MSDNNDNRVKDRPQTPQEDPRLKNSGDKKTFRFKFNLNFVYLLIGMMLLGLMFFNDDSSSQHEVTYGEFQTLARWAKGLLS